MTALLIWVGCDSGDGMVLAPVQAGSGATAGAPISIAGGEAIAGMGVPSATMAGGSGAAGIPAAGAPSPSGTAGASNMAGANGMAGTSGMAGANAAAGSGTEMMPTAGTMAGAAGAVGMAGAPAAGAAAMPREDLGEGDGSDVIAIGDSWMSLGFSGIQQSLVRLSGQPYRTYGVPGTRLLDEVIPRQYASAKRQDPDIKTVVMTGGGNDILLTGAGNDRATAGPNTRMQIDKIADRLESLWAEMATDGVQDIVYIEYSRGGGSEAAVNYATERIKPVCDAVRPTRCHWVDSDLYIMRVLGDGIHPTSDGCDKIATGVIELMEKEGMRR